MVFAHHDDILVDLGSLWKTCVPSERTFWVPGPCWSDCKKETFLLFIALRNPAPDACLAAICSGELLQRPVRLLASLNALWAHDFSGGGAWLAQARGTPTVPCVT